MNYVRNAWYVAGWAHDLATGSPLSVTIVGDPLVLYRTESGRLAALEDRCVHRLAPLSLGRCEGERLRCMYHGLLFDPDGKVAEIPGQSLVPTHARVRAYPIVERHGWLWVWPGDAARADESLIPAAVGLNDPAYILGHSQMDYAAEARLISDNLCDFTHLAYVHANSFGANDSWATSQPKITVLDRGLRFERWVPAQTGLRGSEGPPVDVWSSYDYLVPGILLMPSASYPAGTAEACDFKKPGPDRPSSGFTFTSQAVTPLTAKTARYFFSWGPHKDHGDAALRDMLMGIADMAFTEDRVMIEAQQHVIDATPDPRIMPTSADKGVTLFNRMVAKMVREETEIERAAAA
jgi:phenylpropionate dioxygenase-like ring-hydroxylating dioxygenase large terminal subunit